VTVPRTPGFGFGQDSGTFAGRVGVEIAGTGHALPERVLTNADLEKVMDTSDEWIVQRTGIRQRHIIDRSKGESTTTLAARALSGALSNAGMTARDLDLIICATMTPEMSCPVVSNRVSALLGAGQIGTFDLVGACSGFVYGLNVAHDLVRGGAYRAVGLVGVDTLSQFMDYSTEGRGTAILFGDGGGAAVLRATPDVRKGIIAQAMHSDGEAWKEIYIPRCALDFPPGVTPDPAKHNRVQMNGAGVFKFAVLKFPALIEETLQRANLTPADIDMYVCHQSNRRILDAARERFGLPPEKLYINIDRIGNTSAGSVAICLDEVRRAGRVKPGDKVMFLAFGAGLTWASSLWQM